MSIEYKTGNIFTSNAEVLVNPVNMVGVMGAGLAKQFKIKYPEVFESYKDFTENDGWVDGIWLNVPTIVGGHRVCVYLHFCQADDGKMVVNLPTKKHWAHQSDLSLVRSSVVDFSFLCAARKIKSAALPKLGCGLGGLDWGEVRPIVEDILSGVDTSIEIWSF